ncbi:type IV pilus assembly protein PilE [Noviherbaspirillum humi]|uniref:Type IV pilus assembly protein PilE n=1 Tax=Noviherbaspirillum humi TaxID=1688639 RepID=A0A239DMF0_9BURK|nr:type IV pilin protein [Noviherbaspirillum humi]SNS33028.1 type IV pilus assembly protein PilE [Noviherbaspirillum humi]
MPSLPFQSQKRRAAGFTLVELMVAIVILGIIIGIAVQSYSGNVARGRRASAQAFLMEVAQRQQQYLLDSRAYAPDLATLNTTTPSDVAAYYTINCCNTGTSSANPVPVFSITATPKTGTSQASEVTLSLDNTGARLPSSAW